MTSGNPSEYVSQTGQASVGTTPYSGSTITMSTSKQGFDDFDFKIANFSPEKIFGNETVVQIIIVVLILLSILIKSI
mgnify:CR=1 FL=1